MNRLKHLTITLCLLGLFLHFLPWEWVMFISVMLVWFLFSGCLSVVILLLWDERACPHRSTTSSGGLDVCDDCGEVLFDDRNET